MSIIQKLGAFILAWLVLGLFYFGVYHLEVLLKPMTPFVKFLTFWGQQLFALFVAALVGITHESKRSKNKV